MAQKGYIEVNLDFNHDEIILYDEYTGESTAPTKEAIKATFHGDTFVFYHTGGLPAIFACSGEMLEGGLSCQGRLG